jgi:hypothetical protein
VSYRYPNRSFTVPLNWTVPILTTDLVTNELLNNLYPYFCCSAGQIMNTTIQNKKKGIVNDYSKSLWFIQEAIYVLRNWYNGGFTLNRNSPFSYGAGHSTSIYWADSKTDNSEQVPLVLNVQHGNNVSAFIANLNLALPQGYTASILPNGFSVYIETTNPLQQYIYEVNLFNSNVSSSGIITIDFWSCMSYDTVQNIVQNMNKLCQCPNCGNTQNLETDNNYTSLGQTPPDAVSGQSSYSNTLYD